jgi:hypothetical protein
MQAQSTGDSEGVSQRARGGPDLTPTLRSSIWKGGWTQERMGSLKGRGRVRGQHTDGSGDGSGHE